MPPPQELLKVNRAAPNLCACYAITIKDRATGGEVCDLSKAPLSISYSRSLRGFTSLSMTLINDDPECCDCLPIAWRHELVIERLGEDGQSEGIVWQGPVTRYVDDSVFGTFQIDASDRGIWWQRAGVLPFDIPVGTDHAEAFFTIANYANSLNPGGPIATTWTPSGFILTQPIAAGTPIDTALGSLSGAEWTIAPELYGPGLFAIDDGQSYLTLDTAIDWQDSGAVIDSDFQYVATQVIVQADLKNGPDGARVEGIFPPTSEPHPDYGTHIQVVQAEQPLTQAEADAEAVRIFNRDKDGNRFLVTSGGSLSPTAPVTIWDLVPGRCFRVFSEGSCSGIAEIQRLHNVVVEILPRSTPDGVRLCETRVAIDLQPKGTDRISADRASV
jgi:hypothetical protein